MMKRTGEQFQGSLDSQTSTTRSSKRQRVEQPSRFQTPPEFWDHLSTIPLTGRALRELDRRNKEHLVTNEPDCIIESEGVPNKYLNAAKTKALRRFARQGGPNLSDLRGYPETYDPLSASMSSSLTSTAFRKRTRKLRGFTVSTRRFSAYDRAFEQNLIDHGIYPKGYKFPGGKSLCQPQNLEEIRDRLLRPRASLSPSRFTKEQFERFVHADERAVTEADVMASVVPNMSGTASSESNMARNLAFSNLEPLTNGEIVDPKPDLYCGSQPEELDRGIRDQLAGHILPSAKAEAPMLPNFCLEAKGPDGTLAVVSRQACQDGAATARAMHRIQCLIESSEVYDRQAYSLTSTYHGGQLKIFTTHPEKSVRRGRKTDYHMNLVDSYAMTGNLHSFRQGATAYRNAVDWAKEQRDEMIAAANDRAEQAEIESNADGESVEAIKSIEAKVSAVVSVSFVSNASTDELAIEEPERKRGKR